MQQRKPNFIRNWCVKIGFIAAFFPSFSNAATNFEYPELQVIPRASKRLKTEAEQEPNKRWGIHWPVQTAAIFTLAAAGLHDANIAANESRNRSVGYAVGGFWIAATVAMSAVYQPFSSANEEVSALPGGTKRQQIYKERMAEQELNHMATIGKLVYWTATLTNAAAAGLLTFESQAQSASLVLGGTAIATSLLPVLIGSYWANVAAEQQDYKKRVYGPVASGTLYQDPVSKKLYPGMNLTLRF